MIRDTCRKVEKHFINHFIILNLYARARGRLRYWNRMPPDSRVWKRWKGKCGKCHCLRCTSLSELFIRLGDFAHALWRFKLGARACICNHWPKWMWQLGLDSGMQATPTCIHFWYSIYFHTICNAIDFLNWCNTYTRTCTCSYKMPVLGASASVFEFLHGYLNVCRCKQRINLLVIFWL